MRPSLIMHVNYCEQGQSLGDICRKAVDWGFDGVEFRRTRFGNRERTEDYLDALAAAVRAAGLRQVIFGSPGPNLMAGDAAGREQELAAAVAFYRCAAQRFGTTLCNTFAGELLNPDRTVPYRDYARHGSAVATQAHYHWARDGFQCLAAELAPLGLRFGLETHAGYLHDLPEPTRRLVDDIDSPAVGVTLDYANMLLFPNPPPLRDTIKLLDRRIVYVHLKNVVRLAAGGYLCTPLADGEINHREFLGLLREQGYAGPICLEAPRPGDREWFASQDVAYLMSLLN